MPWYLHWSDSIKKRACRYLLQRYLGQFLEEKLTLDQLTVDLYNGTGSVSGVVLDVQALNELGEQENLPIEFVDGYISEMSVSIPWSQLFTESSYIEVSGLLLTVQPRKRADAGGSVFESMWNSMSNSMQLAAECLQQSSADDKEQEHIHLMEGLELFANAIESVLTRVKIKFLNTIIRIEHLPKQGFNGIAVEVRVGTIDYCDEACSDVPVGEENLQPTYHTSTFSIKKFHCEGVQFFTDEFPAMGRTFSRSIILKQSADKDITGLKMETNPILFGKLSGRQEVRLKLKQDESVLAPKVDIELNLGSLTCFLSPRQVHLLNELMHGLSAPHTQDTSNVIPRSQFSQKIMNVGDYKKVEQELRDNLSSIIDKQAHSPVSRNQGWSSASIDDYEEEFLPMKNASSLSESVLSDNSIDSSMTSTYTSATTNSKLSADSLSWNNMKRRGSKGKCKGFPAPSDCDFHGEITAFVFRLSSLTVLILHEDVLTFNSETNVLIPASVSAMKTLSTTFFQSFGCFPYQRYGNKDFDKVKELLSSACKQSHIRFLATSIVVEGNERGDQSNKSFSLFLTVASMEVVECIFNDNSSETIDTQYVELLKFMRDRDESIKPHFPVSNDPDLKVYILQQKKLRHSNQTTSLKTDIKVTMQQFWTEIDLSIIDRINVLTHPEPLCHTFVESKDFKNEHNSFSKVVENASVPDLKCDFKLSSQFAVLKFRFPIPDLRPIHDIERNPWWRRSVRKDILFLNLIEPTIESNNRVFCQCYKIYCTEILGSFQEGGTNSPVIFARATGDDKLGSKPSKIGHCLGLPCISFRICPKEMIGELEETVEEPPLLTQSCFIDSPQKQPSPFVSKHVVHGNYHPNGENGSHLDIDSDGEELILPAKKADMLEFINYASRAARFQIDVALPFITVHFPSKHFYEVLYNRINSDLSLWQSTAPKVKGDSSRNMNLNLNDYLKHPLFPAFSMCKSGLQYESDSDSDDVGLPASGTYEHKRKPKLAATLNGQSKLALNISVHQGMLNIFTNLRDSSGNIIPEQHGELQINLEDANAFVTTYYKGLPQQNYVCLLVNDASLYHKAQVSKRDLNATSPLFAVFEPPMHLEPTIYFRNNFIPGKLCGSNSEHYQDMLSVAVHTEVNENKIKTIKVSCGLLSATLRHKVCPSQHAWLTQLMDFFDVVDYPVRGYDSPQVITQLHQHVWECAIDYRPLHLPLKSVLTLGSLSVSSNIAARTKTSTLRFIAEDANLFISDKCNSASNLINLQSDYVSVIELGLFELSLRLSDLINSPKVDMKASNNVLHIRTCSDSAHALAQLIKYFASDGDLAKSSNISTHTPSSPILVQTNHEVDDNSLSESTVERVNTMMEDAMQDVHGTDISKVERMKQCSDKRDFEIFVFPDEGNQNEVTTPVDWAGSDVDSENDFCMLDHEAGSGMKPKNGMPEVRVLTTNPIHVVDNHFSLARGKADLLQPPKHYPGVVYRYTLQDMTLIWHMFGGSDFGTARKQKKQLKIDFATSDSNSSVNTEIDESKPESVKFSRERKCNDSPKKDNKKTNPDGAFSKWYVKGGSQRNHHVLMQLQLNKVKFQHEVYPDKGFQASRQVLLIHDLEIRDRLQTSNINKFLYLYTSESSPRQSHANMVVLKAVHVRPDPKRNIQETCLKLSILPLRLNIDQDSLLFLVNFFTQLSGSTYQDSDDSGCSGLQHQVPVMSVQKDKMENSVQQPTLLILLDDESNEISNQKNDEHLSESSGISPMFVRSFVFSPEVPIRIDYEGKRVDMSHGPLAGLLMGLGQLSCLQLKLKKISYRHGILGFDKLAAFVISEWVQDIKKNQLPNLIGGVGPMHSLVQLFLGIRDLFWLPIEQYQKDGRIVRGLQRGANSFTTSTAIAALEITARIVQAIQSVAETAFDILSPGPSARRLRGKKGKRQHHYCQPADIREGMTNAYNLVREGIEETAETLVRVASTEAEQKGTVGAVGGVLRQIPPTVVAPIILASAATSNLLGGVRSHLAPDARREASLKWRTEEM